MVKGGDGEATPIGVASALVTTGTVWCTRAGRGGMSGILLSSYVKRFTYRVLDLIPTGNGLRPSFAQPVGEVVCRYMTQAYSKEGLP